MYGSQKVHSLPNSLINKAHVPIPKNRHIENLVLCILFTNYQSIRSLRNAVTFIGVHLPLIDDKGHRVQ